MLLHAIRILSVDVANAAGQGAIFRAHAEQIAEALQGIDTRSWERRLVGEGDTLTHETILPPDQEAALQRLLSLCQSMS